MKAHPPGVDTHSAFLLTCAGGGGTFLSKSVEARRPEEEEEAETRGRTVERFGEKGDGEESAPPAAEVDARGDRGETGSVRGEATGMMVRFFCRSSEGLWVRRERERERKVEVEKEEEEEEEGERKEE